MKDSRMIPLNLQFFAEKGEGEGNGTGEPAKDQNTQAQSEGTNNQSAHPEFDYEKLAGLITGAQAAKEDSVLKNYFKQQGLSPEEMNQAIKSYKEQKAQNTPDVALIKTQLSDAQSVAQAALVEKEAVYVAMSLNIDAKTVPYILKLADLSNVYQDGKVNQESLQKAIEKVLEDVPQLKPSEEVNQGFRIGGNSGQQSGEQSQTVQKPVPTKRWNRFN